jgi:hypothetical protein
MRQTVARATQRGCRKSCFFGAAIFRAKNSFLSN